MHLFNALWNLQSAGSWALCIDDLVSVVNNKTVFWLDAPCSRLKFANVTEVHAASIIRGVINDGNGGSSKHLWNFGKL